MARLWSILGNSQRLDGGAMFGNVPRAMWSTWLPPDEQHRVPLACRALLAGGIRTSAEQGNGGAGKTVLFETGIGAFFAPKLRERYGVVESEHVLLRSLAAAGFDEHSIDAVVLSHLHFDHAGGLLAPYKEGEQQRLLFPNARYLVGERCWARALKPHARDRASFIAGLPELLEESGRLEVVTGAHSATLGESVRFHYSDGHTPGLMLAEIVGASGREGVVFCSDLIPGRPWVHLPVTMGYDRNPELLIDEKRQFLEDMRTRDVRLFFTHDHGCAMARVLRDDNGRYSATDQRAELIAEPLAG